MTRGSRLSTQYSVLSTCFLAIGLASLLLYWQLWIPAYRLNERFEYVDLLFAAYPWVAEALAAQLAAARAVLPATLDSYRGTAVLLGGLLVLLFVLYSLALAIVGRVPRGVALATLL